MLELRPNCERCDKDLAPDSDEAMICSYECTFCSHCAIEYFKDICPNCQGNFGARPIRTEMQLIKDPASIHRIYGESSLNPPTS